MQSEVACPNCGAHEHTCRESRSQYMRKKIGCEAGVSYTCLKCGWRFKTIDKNGISSGKINARKQ
jgi:DNA-directed RNA polymerase subunit RPC12/RpoP